MITVEYYVPEFKSILDKVDQEREIIKWCWEHFPDGQWRIKQSSALFWNEQDAFVFALRWA